MSSSGKAMTVLGETVKLVPAGSTAAFHISAQGKNKSDIDVQVTSKYIKFQHYPVHSKLSLNFFMTNLVTSFSGSTGSGLKVNVMAHVRHC